MKKVLLSFTVVLLMFSCGSDESDEKVEALMQVEKNGISYSISLFNNTLLAESQSGETGRRLDMRATVDNGTLIISASNWDWQNPPVDGILSKIYDTNVEIGDNAACMDSGGFTYCDGGLVTYLDGANIYISEGIDDEGAGRITISEVDTENKRVSGSFDVTTIDLTTDEKITFTGTFENLNYRTL